MSTSAQSAGCWEQLARAASPRWRSIKREASRSVATAEMPDDPIAALTKASRHGRFAFSSARIAAAELTALRIERHRKRVRFLHAMLGARRPHRLLAVSAIR